MEDTNSVCKLEIDVLDVKYLSPYINVYLKIEIGEQTLQTQQTSTDSNGSGKWNETLILAGQSLEEVYGLELELLLVEKISEDLETDIGSISIPISRLPICQKLDMWFELDPLSHAGKPAGHIRIGFNLEGELRTQVRAALRLLGLYASFVDQGLEQVSSIKEKTIPMISSRAAAASAVPIAGTILASIPLIIIASPLLLPLLLFALFGLLVAIILIAIIGASSKSGRSMLLPYAIPFVEKLRNDSVGQQILYATGPLPSTFSIIKVLMPRGRWGKLIASIIVDIIGCTSYAIPFLGEIGDIAWAPISAILVSALYSESSPYAAYFNFLEEILPFTDIIPTATLAWIKEFAPQFISSNNNTSFEKCHPVSHEPMR